MVHQKPSRVGLHLLRIGVFCILGLLTAALLAGTRYLDARGAPPLPVSRAFPYQPPSEPESAAESLDQFVVAHVPVEHTIRRGETLSEVFTRLDLPPAETAEAVAALTEHLDVRRIRAGQRYTALFDSESGLVGLQMRLGDRGRVEAERSAEGWTSAFVPFERRVEHRAVRGRLDNSLGASIEATGAPATLAYEMAEVLQWDLDFTRDLRRGDRFEVLFGELYLDGERHSLDTILALRYETAGGHLLEAYRFGDAKYYDADGRPLKKMFLRSPLKFSRITSRFSHRRFHPILKRYRPHYGVDYGAPTGTPARVTASGVVTFAGWQRGAGKMVKVRHPNGYLTAYLHLSRFAQGIRAGARVSQGDVIGHVGATGLATAPHLDYRVQKDGRWIDPLSIKSVPAEPIPATQRTEFEQWREALRTSLDQGTPVPELAAPRPTRLAHSAAEELPDAAAGGR